MGILEKAAKRKDIIEKVSYLLGEDPLRVADILDEVALRRASTIEGLEEHLKLLEIVYGKYQKASYSLRVNEFNRCWDALSLKEVQSAISTPEVYTAFSRARKESEARKLAIFKTAVLLENREKEESKSDQG